jgi:hypothetical protein
MSVPFPEFDDGLIDRQHQWYYFLIEIGPEKYLSGVFMKARWLKRSTPDLMMVRHRISHPLAWLLHSICNRAGSRGWTSPLRPVMPYPRAGSEG